MKHALGLIALDGINSTVTAGTLPRLAYTENPGESDHNIGLCLLIYGCGQIAAGYFGGRLCDKFRINKTVLVILFLYCLSCICGIIAWQIKGFWAAAACYLMWGMEGAALGAALMVICSRLYEGHPESFAVVKQFHSVVAVVYMVVMSLTKNSLDVSYIMGGLLVLSGVGFYSVVGLPEEFCLSG